MVTLGEYSGISQLLQNYIPYKFTETRNHFKKRCVVLEVVKLGFWKWSYNIFVKWQHNGSTVKKRVNLYAFILLTSTIVPGINYFVVITHPLHQLQVRKRSSSNCYTIERYNTRHRFPCYWTMNSHILNSILWYFQRMLPELQLLLFFL